MLSILNKIIILNLNTHSNNLFNFLKNFNVIHWDQIDSGATEKILITNSLQLFKENNECRTTSADLYIRIDNGSTVTIVDMMFCKSKLIFEFFSNSVDFLVVGIGRWLFSKIKSNLCNLEN